MRTLHILILLLSLLPLHTAQAAEDKRYVNLRLLPERGTISAEEELWIGIDQSIYPQWHTYWQNPGDSGSAPRIEWTLPEGFEISNIHWPAPHKLPYGPLLNYGYEDHVILLQKLKAPDTLPAGPLTFTADIEILVCKEECIPEFDTLNITLNGPGAATEDNSHYLASAQRKLPTQTDWAVSFNEKDESFLSMFFYISDNMPFHIRENKAYTKQNIEIDINSFEFYPIDWGVVDNTATLEVKRMFDNHSLTVQQKRGDRDLKDLDEISGILSYRTLDGERRDAKFTALPAKERKVSYAAKSPPLKEAGSTTLIGALIFALLGGMAMNLMPCVFPVLSIKALSLVKIADEHPELARLHGLSYTAGVVLSFVAIAGALIALQTAGAGVGWGFQLQNPIVVTLLAYLLFIIGLNLSGLFEFGGEFVNIGGKLTQGSDLGNSFFTGVLATLVATPCTAPFMGAAIGFALTQDPIVSLSVFAALGFGLALPYLALSFAPFLQQALPKPGAWMETFKELLAFPMYASAAWLVWVLSQQAGPMGILGVLMGMVAIAFGAWLLKHRPKSGYWKAKTKIIAVIAFISAIALLPAGELARPKNSVVQSMEFGETYTPEKLEALLIENSPIFVEMTAAWCITCKVNHAIAINTDATKKLFAGTNIRYLIGDWTNQDPEITKYLNRYGRNGVPIYVYYGPKDAETGTRPDPKVLPQILTPGIIKNAITNQ